MAEAFSNVGLLKFLLGLPDLEGLGSVALLDLARDARAEFLKKGDSLYADEHMDRHLYLVEGEVELVANDQILQGIKGGSERAKQSLFRVHTHGLQARSIKPASFLSLNEETYEKYIATIKPKQEPAGISFSDYQEEDDEAAIIAEIRREFNHNEVDLPSMPEVALKINQAIQDEVKKEVAEINRAVQDTKDKVQSVEGRFNQASSFSHIGDDNTIHGKQHINEVPAQNYTVQVAYVDNKDSMYAIAQRYNDYLKDRLYYFEVPVESSGAVSTKYVLLSGNYTSDQKAVAASQVMPTYIERQRPVIRQFETVQAYINK